MPVQIQASGGLSEEEIQRMVTEAEANKEADERKKKAVEFRNFAEAAIQQVEQAISQYKSKVSESKVKALEEDVKKLRDIMLKDDVEAIRRAVDALNAASITTFQEVYSKNQ